MNFLTIYLMRTIRAITRSLPVLFVAVVAFAIQAAAQVPEKPSVPRAVNDFAGIFSVSDAEYMNRVLVSFADSTSNRIVVVTVDDLGGMEPAMFAYEIGEKWGVGSDKFDNGVVVLVKPKTSASSGQVYIAVGYGLEGAIPDAVAKRIVENEMRPRFKENDYAGGVAAALNVLMRLSAGEISYKEYEDSIGAGSSIAMIVFGLLFVLIILGALFGKNGPRNIGSGGSHASSVADAIFWSSILGGGHNHGGGFSGGGFSGGFGGGFGGGSFGGGGAGGSW